MAGSNSRVTIELYVDDQGTVRIRDAKAAVDDLAKGNQSVADSAKGANDNMAAWAGSAQGALVHLAEMVGITLTIAGAVSLVKAGLQEIADFNLGSIATAAMMLSRANIQGIEAQQTAYGEYKSFALAMFEDLEAETTKHFSSGMEMIDTFRAFAMRGIYASQQEAGAIGVITDAVKLLHGGFVDQQTMLHEIQGVLEGHAGRYFKLAEILRGQLGEGWKEIIQSHVDDRTLLGFLEEQFKGLAVAGGDIQKQWMAQKTSLDTILSQIGRGGLSGLYSDIVGLMVDINDYLREHKDDLIVGIAKGWATVKFVVNEVKDLLSGMGEETSKALDAAANKIKPPPGMMEMVSDPATWEETKGIVDSIYSVFTKPILWVTDASNSLKIFTTLYDLVTDLGGIFDKAVVWSIDPSTSALEGAKGIVDGLLEIFSHPITWVINTLFTGIPGGVGGSGTGGAFVGPPEPKIAEPKLTLEQAQKLAAQKAQGIIGLTDPNAGELELSRVPKTQAPPWSPAKPGGGKGGGGAKDTTDSTLSALQQKIDGLLQDIGKINEGTLAGVDAWAKKSIDDIAKVAAKNADNIDVQKAVGVAEGLVAEDAAAKKTKIAQDFSLKMYKMAGDTTTELEIQYNEDLKNAARITGGKELLDQAYAIKRWQVQEQANEKIEGLYKTELAAIAGAVPLLSQQLPIQAQLLDVEIERNRIKMEEQILLSQNDHRLTEAQANEIRGLQAVAAQEQRNAQERKAWMTQGISGGIKSQALDIQKADETAMAEGFKKAFTDARAYVGDTLGTAISDGFFKKGKMNFQQIGQDMASSMIKKLTSLGINKLFDAGITAAAKALPSGQGTAGGILGGILGGGKPDGTPGRPLHVVMAAGGSGIKGIFGGDKDMSPEAYDKVFTDAETGLTKNVFDYTDVFSMAEGGLLNESTTMGDMFGVASSGLSEVSDGFGSMFGDAISGLMSAISGGGGGGGGGIFGMIGSVVGGIASFLLHSGGVQGAGAGGRYPGLRHAPEG